MPSQLFSTGSCMHVACNQFFGQAPQRPAPEFSFMVRLLSSAENVDVCAAAQRAV